MSVEGFREAREFYKKAGIGAPIGFGERPAVIVVDFTLGFTDPKVSPLGSDYDAEVSATGRLLDLARELGFPVFFTSHGYKADLSDAGIWPRKVPAQKTLIKGTPATEIDGRLGVREAEVVIPKIHPSAFHGTPLLPMLVMRRVDTLIVAGVVTSGCVRATVVDGVSYGYRVIVPRECVGDRHPLPHEAALFDIDTKYGDVLGLDEVMGEIERRWGK